jgi:ankyrin repeat protein
LHAAIRDDKIIMVRLLIELGADTNDTVNGRTALHTATFRVNCQFVELLLGAGADPTLRDSRGCTALHQAIMNGFEKTIAALIRGGADVNACTHIPVDKLVSSKASGLTPLMLTCGFRPHETRYCGKPDPALPTRIAQLLLSAGADTTPLDTSGNAALHYAIMACDLDLVRLLLENGAKIQQPDINGYCIIHAFAQGRAHGRSPEHLQNLLDLLLERTPAGAESMEWRDASFRNMWGQKLSGAGQVHCPLSVAIQCGNWDIFTALLKRGGHLRTTHPLEPFLKAAMRELQPGAVHFLLDQGAKPGGEGGDVADLLRKTDLLRSDECAREAFALILKDLAKSGVDVKSVGDTLFTAVKHIDIPCVVQALLDVGADLYQTDETGLDVFMVALVHEKVASLCCLLENTAKIPHSGLNDHWTQVFPSTSPDDSIAYVCARLKQNNLVLRRTNSNRSLLQLAVEAGSAQAVAHLIACGADPEEADEDGWRPLHTAILQSHGAVVDVLLATGLDVHAPTRKWSHDWPRPSGLWVGHDWTGQPLHLAAMTGDARIVAELLKLGADVRASTGSERHCFLGHGPTALHIALDKGQFYGRKGEVLDRGRLEIATMLVDHGADVNGVASSLTLEDVLLFEGREYLWNKLRVGVTEEGLSCKDCAAYLPCM